MSDDPSEGIAKAGAAAAIAAIDPTGGIGIAVAQHLAATMMQDAAWRRETQDLWVDILLEKNDERRQEYARAESEFERHKKLIEWLQDELQAVRKDVEGLQAVAMHLIAESEELLRARPDPEMRPYLVAAFHNTIRFPEKFRPTWVRRLTALLRKLGADHLRYLLDLVEGAGAPNEDGSQVCTWERRGWEPDALLVHQDLRDMNILQHPPALRGVTLSLVGATLAEFVFIAPE